MGGMRCRSAEFTEALRAKFAMPVDSDEDLHLSNAEWLMQTGDESGVRQYGLQAYVNTSSLWPSRSRK
jgi:hypothetical protein